MDFQGTPAGICKQPSPLIRVEIERPLEHRPGRCEQEEGSGEIEKERTAAGRSSRGGVLANGQPETLERGSQSRLQSLNRDIATIREVPEKQTGLVRVGLHPAEDPIHGIGNLEGRGVLTRGGPGHREFGECGCGAPQHQSIELLLAAEVVGDRAGVGPRQVADVAD